jgi:hypothetical protein
VDVGQLEPLAHEPLDLKRHDTYEHMGPDPAIQKSDTPARYRASSSGCENSALCPLALYIPGPPPWRKRPRLVVSMWTPCILCKELELGHEGPRAIGR